MQMLNMCDIDLSKYENRLQTFNDFPAAFPIFIKDLVEAGFCFTGTGCLVFCFSCGYTCDKWQDGDDPLAVHYNGSKQCPYLCQRSDSACSSGVSNCHVRFYWDHENRCLVKVDELSPQVLKVVHTAPTLSAYSKQAPSLPSRTKSESDIGRGKTKRAERFPSFDKKSGYENLPSDIDRLVEKRQLKDVQKSPASPVNKYQLCMMRNRGNRLRTFTFHFPLLIGPDLENLANAGFFYSEEDGAAKCFACTLQINDWQSCENPEATHFERSPKCDFLQSSTMRTNGVWVKEERDDKSGATSSSQSHRVNANGTHEAADTSLSFEVKPYHTNSVTIDNNKVLPKIIIPTPFELESMTRLSHKPNSSRSASPKSDTDLDRSTRKPSKSEVSILHACPVANRLPSWRMSGGSPTEESSPKSAVPYNYFTDMSDRDRRLQSYSTWPQESPLAPFDLATAGFYYTGFKDGVKCYACGIALKDWCTEDTAWGEHQKWSPNCELVRVYKTQHSHSSEDESVTNEVNRLNRSESVFYNEDLPSFERAESGSSQMEPASPESTEMPCDISYDRLIDGKCIANTDVLQSLLEMGYTLKLIKEVKDLYLSECNSFFGSPDELIEAILYFQENKSLNNFTYASFTYPVHVAHKENPLVPQAPPPEIKSTYTYCPSVSELSTNQTPQNEKLKLQQELEKAMEVHTCKICMDREISVVFLPCRHLICCQECSVGLKDCPMCREPITSRVETFLS